MRSFLWILALMSAAFQSQAAWVNVGAGVPSPLYVQTVPGQDKIYAGTNAQGIYMTTNGGISWTNFADRTSATVPSFTYNTTRKAFFAVANGSIFRWDYDWTAVDPENAFEYSPIAANAAQIVRITGTSFVVPTGAGRGNLRALVFEPNGKLVANLLTAAGRSVSIPGGLANSVPIVRLVKAN